MNAETVLAAIRTITELIAAWNLEPKKAFEEAADLLSKLASSDAALTPERLDWIQRQVHATLRPLMKKVDI